MLLLFFYLLNLYIRPQDWISGFYGLPVDYMTIIPAMAYGFLIQIREKRMLIRLPQYLFLVVFLIIVFLSNAVNGNIVFGLLELVKFLKLVCIFIIILLLVRSTVKLKWTLFFIVLFSVFIGGQAIVQFITGGLGIAGQDFYRSGEGIRTTWIGLWNGSNITSLLLNCSIPFALEFVFGPYTKLWKILNLVFTGCLVGGVYTNNSRGGFITLLAILFLYPMFRVRKKKVAIILGILLAGAIFVYLAPSRSGEISSTADSAYERIRLWGNAVDMFKDHPLLGIGKGKFMEANERHLMAHSNFMQNLAETGGVGIFVWLALLYFSFKGLFYASRIKPDNKKELQFKSLSRAILVSMLGFNIGTLFITMDIDLFYLLLGLSAATANIMNMEIKNFKIRFSLKDFLAILGIIFCLWLFYHHYIK